MAGAGTAPWQAQAHPGPRLCPSPGPVAWGGPSLCPSGSPGRPAERGEGTRARRARQRRGGGRSSASRAGSWVATRGPSAAQVGAAGGLSVVARALRPRRRPAGAKLAGSAPAGRPLRFGATPLLPFCASDALAAVPLGPTSGKTHAALVSVCAARHAGLARGRLTRLIFLSLPPGRMDYSFPL